MDKVTVSVVGSIVVVGIGVFAYAIKRAKHEVKKGYDVDNVIAAAEKAQ